MLNHIHQIHQIQKTSKFKVIDWPAAELCYYRLSQDICPAWKFSARNQEFQKPRALTVKKIFKSGL